MLFIVILTKDVYSRPLVFLMLHVDPVEVLLLGIVEDGQEAVLRFHCEHVFRHLLH